MPQNRKTYIFLLPLTPAHEVHNPEVLPLINEDSFVEPLTPEDFDEQMESTESGEESQSDEEAEKTPTVFDADNGLGIDCIPTSNSFTGIKQLQKSIDGVCVKDNHDDAGDSKIAQAAAALHHAELDSLFIVTAELDKISAEINELREKVLEIAKSIQFKMDSGSKKCD
ncbi:hypothetical protein R3P38DRAFT_3210473 [Favolaschia claudopus]|uniref:Uncharacterized protein n=1 Tax=Favolaschia claudopus TaxID=2862362 RepID=A0AAW0AG93_9AGAR